MDASELAKLMLQWEQLQRRADEMAEAIKDAVLQMEKSQTVGNVKATYYSGRKSYKYWDAAAASGAADDPDIVAKYSEWQTDWRALCKGEGIEAPFTESPPSVSLKLN